MTEPPLRTVPAHEERWHEHWLSPAGAGAAADASSSLAAGHSVLLAPSFATSAECDEMMAAGRRGGKQKVLKRGLSQVAVERLWSDLRSKRTRLTVAEDLDEAAGVLCQTLLRRLLDFIEAQLPVLAATLLCGRATLSEVDLATDYSFADAEPAVNIYGVGGQFKPHEDKQRLTILVPLSDNAKYEGGGTAFWSEEARGPGRSLANQGGPPTCVLQPPAGTALLFGGEVTHGALPVTSGERIVFVASFTPKVRTEAEMKQAEEDLKPLFSDMAREAWKLL